MSTPASTDVPPPSLARDGLGAPNWGLDRVRCKLRPEKMSSGLIAPARQQPNRRPRRTRQAQTSVRATGQLSRRRLFIFCKAIFYGAAQRDPQDNGVHD